VSESLELPLRSSKGAVLLSVQAQPGARREGLDGLHGGRLRVRTHEPPEGGRANASISRLVAEALGLSRGAVRVASGAASRRKELVLESLDLGEARRRLQEALSPSSALGDGPAGRRS
jgi:uncharacterized protein (TIGR00251 family)